MNSHLLNSTDLGQRHHAMHVTQERTHANIILKKPIMNTQSIDIAIRTHALTTSGGVRLRQMATGGTESSLGPLGDARLKDTRVKLFNAKKTTAIGTWNVRTLWRDGSLELLINALDNYKWDVIGLSEVRRTGSGEVEHNGCRLLFSGHTKDHKDGVGILLSKEASKSLIGFTPISPRVIMASFYGLGQNITIIQAYAPTTDHDDDELEEFYASIQNALENTDKKDIKIVMGDFNAKVGKENNTWNGIIGHHGYGVMNERGERLLQFCLLNKLGIMNTWFEHKDAHKWTWAAPVKTALVVPWGRNRKEISTKNMIDYIMIDQRWKSSITDVRSFPSSSIGSDHILVRGLLRIRFQAKKIVKNRAKLDIEKLLHQEETQIEYQLSLKNRFDLLGELPEDLDEALTRVNHCVQEVAQEVIGNIRKKKTLWISNEVLDIADKRRKIKSELYNKPSLKPTYNKLTREIRSGLSVCQQNWTEQQCLELEKSNGRNDLRRLFKKVKEISGGVTLKVRSSNIKDEEAKLLANEDQIKAR